MFFVFCLFCLTNKTKKQQKNRDFFPLCCLTVFFSVVLLSFSPLSYCLFLRCLTVFFSVHVLLSFSPLSYCLFLRAYLTVFFSLSNCLFLCRLTVFFSLSNCLFLCCLTCLFLRCFTVFPMPLCTQHPQVFSLFLSLTPFAFSFSQKGRKCYVTLCLLYTISTVLKMERACEPDEQFLDV